MTSPMPGIPSPFNPSVLVEKSTPFVHAGVWSKLCEDGWRWVQNFTFSEKEGAKRTIAQHQNDLGAQKVAVGHPFTLNKGPVVAYAQFAIYVRDGDQMMDLLRKELDAFVGL